MSAEPVNVREYERLAEERLDPGAFGYFAGGAGDEWTLRENVAAYRRWHLRPRVLVDVSGTTTATTVLGRELALPVLVAPMAFQRVAHPDGERAMARAAAAAGTAFCLSTLATTTPADVAEAVPGGNHWFQLYWYSDPGITRSLVEQAADAGFQAIVLTVDTPRLGRRERDLRSGFIIPADVTVPSFAAAVGGPAAETPAGMFRYMSDSVTWRELETLTGWSPLPVLVKGIMSAEDAGLAADAGAAGVIVSNHGGRQLDGVAASLDALPEAVAAVDGRVEVLVDGGIRRGTDVLVALALGARAALVGRAVLWGLVVDGDHGARRVLELLREEIELSLKLLGCPSPAAVTREHVAGAS